MLQPAFENTLVSYFSERLQEVSADLEIPPHEDTVWYMSRLLARFGLSDQLFCLDQGRLSVRPLALLYRDALEASHHRERCILLRQLGDLALFMGALFPENYSRRGILKDYFVGMGGSAYSYLSENAHQNRHIFSELASMFARMLDLVAKVCSRQNVFDALDVLSLYQRWQNSGDPLIAKQLITLGINLPCSHKPH